MKYYNQKYGFEKGDALLQCFAQLLTGYFKTENCSRFGQDHFAVYTDEQGLEDTLRHIFEDWEIGKASAERVRLLDIIYNSFYYI